MPPRCPAPRLGLAVLAALLPGCADFLDAIEPPGDLTSEDVPAEQGERPTEEELAAEEAAAGEVPLARPAPGGYDWDATDAHAARVNPHRVGHGVAALARDACLDGVARRWSLRMASGVCGGDDLICHRGEAGPSGLATQVERCWRWSRIGENVGYGPSEGSLWQGFLGSPGHHANVDGPWPDGGAGKFGIGVFRRSDGYVFVTHVFATRW